MRCNGLSRSDFHQSRPNMANVAYPTVCTCLLHALHSLPYPINPQQQNNGWGSKLTFHLGFRTKIPTPSPKETFSTENSYISSLTHTSRGCGMIDATNSILLLPGLAWPGEFPGSLRLTTEVFPFPFSRDICPAGPIMARVLLRLGIKTSHHHSLGCQPACFVH